ncbi:MAG: hypothetical protein E6R09_18540 [Rhodocyclaceae bacterium]|nr:MAG: hypothetical protein E6R09_18540 [Rhodocyclaceae bacterium]
MPEGYLQRRISGYYFRIAVPKRLRPILGCTSIIRALSTTNPLLARLQAAQLAFKYSKHFRMALTCENEFDRGLGNSDDMIKKLILKGVTPDRIEEVHIENEKDLELFARLKQITGDAEPPSQQRSPKKTEGARGLTVKSASEKFLADKAREGVDSKTIFDYRTSLRLFSEALPNRAIADVTRDDARTFHDLLSKLPRDTTKRAEFRGKSIRQCVAMNESVGSPPIQPKTIVKHLDVARAMMHWARREKMFEGENPLTGFKIKVPKRSGRTGFSPQELSKIFEPVNYSALVRDPADFWLPQLGLMSGARIGELTQLHVTDVRQENGIWYLCINGDGSDANEKKLKTETSERTVPIHSQLIANGFLRYVAAIQQAGFVRLFPHLTYDAHNTNYAKKPMRHFAEYVTGLGIKNSTDRYQKTFHSFRHNVVTQLQYDQQLREEQYYEITGHDHDSITARNYVDRARLPYKRDIVEKISFDGVDLTKLPCPESLFTWIDTYKMEAPLIEKMRARKQQIASNRKAALAARAKRAAERG